MIFRNQDEMKDKIIQLLKTAIDALVDCGEIPQEVVPNQIPLEHSRRKDQGDYATAVVLAMARASGRNSRELATLVQQHLPASTFVKTVEVAGPGFINFYLKNTALADTVAEVLEQRDAYGNRPVASGGRVLIEFVSANPTGPLHVGHGRGAAFGDTLARLLRAAGNEVDTEYYVNDLGRQIDILSLSVWIRYLQLEGQQVQLPSASYQGDYIIDVARELQQKLGSDLVFDLQTRGLDKDPDSILTDMILEARTLMGVKRFRFVRDFVLERMINIIQSDLAALGIKHDTWFFESQVAEEGDLKRIVDLLWQRDCLIERDGATWFKSSAYGDEKDRVLIRSGGEYTYFASDIAYHLNKLQRGYDYIINIWGADHHGYIARMNAAIEAAGKDPKSLKIFLVQFASLYRGKQKIPMSTRAGEFVSLQELVGEIGCDAARFFYVLRKSEQHLDFDLELAKQQSSENPVYYVQYAHARICSIFRQMSERGLVRATKCDFTLLKQDVELNLIKRISRYPELIQGAALAFEPHQVAYFLRDLATEFHSFYNRERILDCDPPLCNARLGLIDAVRQVIANGLRILGVTAPESM